MFTTVLWVFLYEVALKTLPRVRLKEKPGVIGLILQNDQVANTIQVHWGVSDKQVFQSWHKADELEEVTNGEDSPTEV